MQNKIKKLLFNSKFYYITSILTAIFVVIYAYYSYFSNRLNVFLLIEVFFHLVLTISMTYAYKKYDIVDLSGFIGCVLALKIAKYSFLLQQYYELGRTAILDMGLVECITLSCTLMMFSQFHSKMPIDAKGSIEDIDIQKVIDKKGTYIYQTDDFYIIFLEYESVEFFSNDRPKKSDDSITFCGAAAFFLDYSLSFDENKVCGDYTHLGKLTHGYQIQNLGAFTFYNNEFHLVTDSDPISAIETSAINGGEGFQQLVAMSNCVGNELQIGETRCLRVLSQIQGRLCLIDSINMISYEDFISDLKSANIEDALYLEMGAGWNYSWYRLENNHTKNIFGLPFPFSHNWIVFIR